MNMNYTLDSNAPNFKKDVIYRFLNSTHINWEKFLLLLSSTIIKNSIVKLTSEDKLNAIVIDDSFYGRTRSKTVELLSNVAYYPNVWIICVITTFIKSKPLIEKLDTKPFLEIKVWILFYLLILLTPQNSAVLFLEAFRFFTHRTLILIL